MAWDASRPVPWKRFMREWAVYAAVFAVVVLIIKRDDLQASQFIWIALSLPIWVGFSIWARCDITLDAAPRRLPTRPTGLLRWTGRGRHRRCRPLTVRCCWSTTSPTPAGR